MPVETTALLQKAVVWDVTRYDGAGDPVVGEPYEIDSRWEKVKKTIRGPQGSPIVIDAQVDVDRVITNGSHMWEGKLADLPDNPSDVYEVVTFDDIPDVKNVEHFRTVTLSRIN